MDYKTTKEGMRRKKLWFKSISVKTCALETMIGKYRVKRQGSVSFYTSYVWLSCEYTLSHPLGRIIYTGAIVTRRLVDFIYFLHHNLQIY
jgi:hypothetical protein